MSDLLLGDSRELLRELEDNSVDTVVTDPPYFIIDNNGNGFMGKKWDSLNTNDMYPIICKSPSTVLIVEKFLLLLKIESETVEEKIAQESVNMNISENQKEYNLNVQYVKNNSNDQQVRSNQNISSAQGFVLTKEEVLDMLNELSENHTSVIESLEDNVLFAIPYSLIKKLLKNTAVGHVLKFPILNECSVKIIHLTLTEDQKIKDHIVAASGQQLESKLLNEMVSDVRSANRNIMEENYTYITLPDTKQQETIQWIISSLFAFTVMEKSKVELIHYLIIQWHKSWLSESLRVLKPGAFAFIMQPSRSNLLKNFIQACEEVGFVTEFSPIFWSYATGFPKAAKIEEGVYAGFQPKPAVEPIIVVMKPLTEKSYKAQFSKNGHGITRLDDARIPVPDVDQGYNTGGMGFQRLKSGWDRPWMHDKEHVAKKNKEAKERYKDNEDMGRFPANLIVQNDSLNTGETHSSGKLEKHHHYGANSYQGTDTFKMRDRSGEIETYGDSGSYSRFFDLDAWFYRSIVQNAENLPDSVRETFPFLVTPKPSVSEKNVGLEDMETSLPSVLQYHRPTALSNPENWDYLPSEVPFGGTNRAGNQQNAHPTVKPIKLMSWLIQLGCAKGEVVLDPFVGSGTTAIASVLCDRQYLGMEVDEEYFKIAWKRLSYWKKVRATNLVAKDVLDGL